MRIHLRRDALTFLVSDALSGVVTQASVLGELPDLRVRIDGQDIPVTFDEFDRSIPNKTLRIRCILDTSLRSALLDSSKIEAVTKSGKKYSLKELRVTSRDSSLRCEMLLIESDT